ncbi:hypothetical protein PFISCL1PPCAC_8059, partial [Pristionchus fissidentatus]
HFIGPPHDDVDCLGFESPWTSKPTTEWSVDPAYLASFRREFDRFHTRYSEILARRLGQWQMNYPRERGAMMHRYVVKGVPMRYRKEVWMRNIAPFVISPSSSSLPFSDSVDHSIRIDLPRTFPDNRLLRVPSIGSSLYRNLSALALHIPAIGYCQGLNFIAALCLLLIGEESRSRDLLLFLVLPRVNYYTATMSGLIRDMRVLEEIVSRDLPEVHSILTRLDVGLDLLVGKWFLCLFIDSLPMETVLRVWDCLIYEGDVWLFKIAFRLLRKAKKRIAGCHSSDQLLKTVREMASSKDAMDCHSLITTERDRISKGE